MASSWITTPHLRPSSPDTTFSESHPGVLAHERGGPFAISAAQICVKIGEDGQPSLPSDVVVDKRYTHGNLAAVTLQVEDRPLSPSDVHMNMLPLSPLLKHARPQSPSSNSTLERQVLASVPTTNSQPVPISASGNSPPPPNSPNTTSQIIGPNAVPTNVTGSPSISYSQQPTPVLNQTTRPGPSRSWTLRTSGTGGGDSIAKSDYTEMVFEPIPFRYNVLTCVCLWIILAGFLVLPSSFPEIQTLAGDIGSNKVNKVLRVARNVPLLAVGFTGCGIGTIGLCYLWWRFSHNYIWLLSSIFIPGLFNGLSGLISTFVNLYGSQQSVHYGVTTIATISATGGCAAICGFLTIVYTIKKHLVKKEHDKMEKLASS